MTDTGTAAVFVGTGEPFELKEYPLLDPEPGAILARVRLANICGSDLHMWRGELDLERLKLPIPLVLGHEAVGEVVALGQGVSTDFAGEPLWPRDLISWRYFSPCGRCPACMAGMTRACQENHSFISGGSSASITVKIVPWALRHQLSGLSRADRMTRASGLASVSSGQNDATGQSTAAT